MTPSEIAAGLEAQHRYDKVHYPPVNPLFAQAADTIRELEAQNERLIHKLGVERKHGEQQSAKLKIATEALNSAAGVLSGEEMTKGSLIRALEQVNKALARIKELTND